MEAMFYAFKRHFESPIKVSVRFRRASGGKSNATSLIPEGAEGTAMVK